MSQKEIKSLTGLRGIAALFVVLHHFYGYYLDSLPSKQSAFETPAFNFFIHGYLSVDIFFMLSAFVITLSSKKYFTGTLELHNYQLFMKKRWIRIYPSYFFAIVYGLIFIYHFKRLPNFLISLTLLNSAVRVPQFLTHLWSLSTEWITYLLYPLFYKFFALTKNPKWKYVLIVLGLVTIYTTGALNAHQALPQFMLELFQGYPSLCRCFGDYLMGMGIYYIFTEKTLVFLNNNIASILIAGLIIISLFFSKADMITVFLSMLLIISISTDQNTIAKLLSSKVIYFLGIISYPLYLTHYLVYMQLPSINLFLQLHFSSNYPITELFVVYLTISLVIAIVMTYAFEMPVIRFLNRTLLPKTKATIVTQ